MLKVLRKGSSKKSFLTAAIPVVSLLSSLGLSAPAQAATFELGVVSSSSAGVVVSSSVTTAGTCCRDEGCSQRKCAEREYFPFQHWVASFWW